MCMSVCLFVVHLLQRVALRRKRLVIVNLQQTPLDSLASLRINCKCDDVSQMLMKKLGKEIPEFRLRRYITTAAVLHSQTICNIIMIV